MTDTCTSCGAQDIGIGWFGPSFRKMELRHGRPDPGNLCGKCAGRISGNRIGDEVLAVPKGVDGVTH